MRHQARASKRERTYSDFREEHEGWIEKEKLDHEKLQRKMRLLTFASLAASTPNREIPYANIAKALQLACFYSFYYLLLPTTAHLFTKPEKWRVMLCRKRQCLVAPPEKKTPV